MNKIEIMQLGIDKARITMNQDFGGPFGAIITKDNQIVAVASNTTLRDNDPTAHAEINAIREAGKVLKTNDLSGCVLYATGYPCPMCLSAIMWANIKEVYYGAKVEEAEKIGFRDKFIYEFIKNDCQGEPLKITQLDPYKCNQDCINLYKEYEENGKVIY